MLRVAIQKGAFHRPFLDSLRVLSLSAGIQSTALALLAVHGMVGPMPGGRSILRRGSRAARSVRQRMRRPVRCLTSRHFI
jgi:hypothetical protein